MCNFHRVVSIAKTSLVMGIACSMSMSHFFGFEGSTNISRGTIDSHHFIPVSETLHAFID